MGTCFGKCLSKSKQFNIFQNKGPDFNFLVENQSIDDENKRNIFNRFFNKKRHKKPVLQLVDDLLNPQRYSRLNDSQKLPSTSSCTSRDIQLQCLDARALLARTTTSTPASSLDLEWEHETLQTSMVHDPSGNSWMGYPEINSYCPSESSPQHTAQLESDWSRVSSINSLEWDVNSYYASPQHSEIDTDTQLLLNEIERLTNKTLEETGCKMFS